MEPRNNLPSVLQVSDLQHSVTTPMSFRLEYKRGSTAPAMFQRQVRGRLGLGQFVICSLVSGPDAS